MQFILSPAKTFRQLEGSILQSYKPLMFDEATQKLINHLQNYTEEDLGRWMKVSPALAQVNQARFMTFYDAVPKAYEAVSYLDGEAYKGLEGHTLDALCKDYLQDHLLILSGLYGCIHATDTIQPYRLEMGSKMEAFETKDLYSYWKETLTHYMCERLAQDAHQQVLVNLASTEYSKALDLKAIKKQYPVLTIHFKEQVGEDTYKVVGMYAKKARGSMVRYCAKEQVTAIEQLKQYNVDGYTLNEGLSTEWEWVYTR